MVRMKKRWLSLLLVLLLALPGCGRGKGSPSSADSGASSSSTESAASTDGSSTAVTTQSTTASTGIPTTAAPATKAPPVKAATYTAHDVLKESLDAGGVKADAVWKPVYLDANCIDGWKEMLTNDETFSMKNLDNALPYVRLPDEGGVVLNANQWASGSLYWDKAGVAYTAPYAHEAILKAGTIKTISAATATDEGALSKTEGRVAIYKNDEKIWPENDDYHGEKRPDSRLPVPAAEAGEGRCNRDRRLWRDAGRRHHCRHRRMLAEPHPDRPGYGGSGELTRRQNGRKCNLIYDIR